MPNPLKVRDHFGRPLGIPRDDGKPLFEIVGVESEADLCIGCAGQRMNQEG
jgi:hypothetical protein